MEKPLRIGVLALQGNFREHAAMLRRLGAEPVEVRLPEQLDGLDGLIIPGGESTAIGRLMRLYGIDEALRRFEAPIFGTCAGMIVLDRDHLALGDFHVRRNAFGRQVRSFEADLDVVAGEEPVRAVFIRAPWIEDAGPGVEILAEVDGHAVLAREGRLLVAAFHPELTDDTRIHELFLNQVREAQELSGHSKWSSIKHKKGAADAKRGKLFSKLTRAIIVAAREGGPDPAGNLALQNAVEKARSYSMPKDNIDRAIAKGSGADSDTSQFETVVYEGYGPSGVAVIVESLTDNRNRTAAEVRHTFAKNDGNLGTSGAVLWLFERRGVVLVDAAGADEDELTLAAAEGGAEDVVPDGSTFQVTSAPEDLAAVREAIEAAGFTIESAELTMVAKTIVEVEDESDAKKILRLIDELEDNDDVQEVFANFDIPERVLEAVAGYGDVLLLDRAGGVHVDPHPDAGVERLEQLHRGLPRHELRQLRDRDRRAVDVRLRREHADGRRRRDEIEVRPVALVDDVVVVRDRLAGRDRSVLGGGGVGGGSGREHGRVEPQLVAAALADERPDVAEQPLLAARSRLHDDRPGGRRLREIEAREDGGSGDRDHERCERHLHGVIVAHPEPSDPMPTVST